MKCFQKAKRSINPAFQELNQNEQSRHRDLETHSQERLYFTTKTLKQYQNTKNTSLRIQMYKKTYCTRCLKQGRT